MQWPIKLQRPRQLSAGMLPFPTPFQFNLTWTVGLRGENRNTSTIYQTWYKDHYLGAPPTLDLRQESVNGWIGCAAFFVDSNASFPLRQPPGICDTVIGAGCVEALQQNAVQAAEHVDDAASLCASLDDAFQTTPPEACSAMSLEGDSWGRIRFRRKSTSPRSLRLVLTFSQPSTARTRLDHQHPRRTNPQTATQSFPPRKISLPPSVSGPIPRATVSGTRHTVARPSAIASGLRGLGTSSISRPSPSCLFLHPRTVMQVFGPMCLVYRLMWKGKRC